MLSAWKALQSEAMVTGYAVPGKARQGRCAWNFRASECRAELVRVMPSATENVKEIYTNTMCFENGDLFGRTNFHEFNEGG